MGIATRCSQRRRHFEHVICAPRISARIGRDLLQYLIACGQLHRTQAPFAVGKCSAEQNHYLLLCEWPEHINAAARKQSRNDLKRRILGGGADQPNIAFLDVRQESILLGLIEAMNLINKDDGPCAVLARPFGLSHDLLDFFYSGEDCAELNKLRASHSRNNLR